MVKYMYQQNNDAYYQSGKLNQFTDQMNSLRSSDVHIQVISGEVMVCLQLGTDTLNNSELLSAGASGTKYSESKNEISSFSFMEMHLNMSCEMAENLAPAFWYKGFIVPALIPKSMFVDGISMCFC